MAPKRVLTQLGDNWKLSGDTFTIKEELKRIGARYDGAQRCWFIGASESTFKKLEFLGFLATAPLTSNSTDILDSAAVATPQPLDISNASVNDSPSLSVSQFTQFVESVIQRHLGFDFWLVGEISSLKSSSGHLYFDLVEPAEERALETGRAASVSCCLWAGKARRLADKLDKIELSEGLKIKVKAHCEFRKEGSRLSVIVDDIDPHYTLGDLALQRQNIVRELKRRNLYNRQRDHARWSAFPLKIALITAAGSRAQTDFLDELRLSGLHFSIVLFDCHMQGERVEHDVTTAFSHISNLPQDTFDCIVLTRGGGSRLDLRWFDNLEIGKAIAYCSAPVLTAIGHFEDVSIADEVASVAEKTPTGAARYLCQRVASQFELILTQLERQAHRRRSLITSEKTHIERTELKLEQICLRRIERETSRIAEQKRTLNLISKTALQPLKRGFSLLRSTSGHVLTADDFLTSENPETIQIELQSNKKNAQVLITANIISTMLTDTPELSASQSSHPSSHEMSGEEHNDS